MKFPQRLSKNPLPSEAESLPTEDILQWNVTLTIPCYSMTLQWPLTRKILANVRSLTKSLCCYQEAVKILRLLPALDVSNVHKILYKVKITIGQ